MSATKTARSKGQSQASASTKLEFIKWKNPFKHQELRESSRASLCGEGSLKTIISPTKDGPRFKVGSLQNLDLDSIVSNP